MSVLTRPGDILVVWPLGFHPLYQRLRLASSGSTVLQRSSECRLIKPDLYTEEQSSQLTGLLRNVTVLEEVKVPGS